MKLFGSIRKCENQCGYICNWANNMVCYDLRLNTTEMVESVVSVVIPGMAHAKTRLVASTQPVPYPVFTNKGTSSRLRLR